MTGQTSDIHFRRLLIAYFGILAVFAVASFFPESRLWGINWWGYYPLWLRAIMLAIGAGAGVLVGRSSPETVQPESSAHYRYALPAVAVLSIILFTLLHNRVHFLGDGYPLLANLADNLPIIKWRNFGETYLRVGLYQMLGGQGEPDARLTYQIASVVSGAIFVSLLAWLSKYIVESARERFWFVLGLVTAGYALLFFGYVEHYTLFVPAVVITLLVGFAVLKGRIRLVWALLAFAISILLHIFGLILLPAMVYLVWTRLRRESNARPMARPTVWLLLTFALVTGVAVYFYAYTSNYTLRFALLPLFVDRFTVDNYTMFAWRHLLDIANQLLMLLPALPLLAIIWWTTRRSKLWRTPPYRFLQIAAVCVVLAALAFDPKLGLPRDWDLFAFIGAPFVVLLYVAIFESSLNLDRRIAVAALSVTLSLLVLGPRVAALAIPQTGERVYVNYLDLDLTRGRVGRLIYMEYLEDRNRLRESAIQRTAIERLLPHHVWDKEAKALFNEGKVREALTLSRRSLQRDPQSWKAWAAVAGCYLQLNMIDSAAHALTISHGFNPYNGSVHSMRGVVATKRKQFDDAIEHFERATELDDTLYQPRASLALLHFRFDNPGASKHQLQALSSYPNAPVALLRRLGDNFVEQAWFEHARIAYRAALDRGLDTAYFQQQVAKYPALAP